MIYIGIPFGPAADPQFRQMILDRLQTGSAPPIVAAWTSALLDYPPVEPADMRCPTLWMVGTNNPSAVASANTYELRWNSCARCRVDINSCHGARHGCRICSSDRHRVILWVRPVAKYSPLAEVAERQTR